MNPNRKFFWPLVMFCLVTWSAASQADITTGLVAYYPFSGNVNDDSWNGNNGTTYGSPTLTSDRHGNAASAYYFDGTDDYIDTRIAANGTTFSYWTLSVWVKADTAPLDSRLSYPLHANGLFEISWDHTNPIYRGAAITRVSSLYTATFETLAGGTWYHLAATYDSYNGKLKSYKNGVLTTTTDTGSGAPTGSSNNIELGRHLHGGYFAGVIDEVRIYSRNLSDADILTLYQTESPAPPISVSLDSPAGPDSPGSGMYTIDDIYNYLAFGIPAQKRQEGFTQPTSGPQEVGYSLDDLYALVRLKRQLGVLQGKCVPKTGQTDSYADYDDGYYQKGCEPALVPSGQSDFGNFNRTNISVFNPVGALVDNGDGTVTDRLTGLVWLKNANCFGNKTWTEALSLADGLASGQCGLTDGSVAGDWRLPNINELRSLFDPRLPSPYLPNGHPFTDESHVFWTSSYFGYGYAWGLNAIQAYLSTNTISSLSYVWPVRGGQ